MTAAATKTSAKAARRSISATTRARTRARPIGKVRAGDTAAVWVDPHKLVPHPKNPRRNDKAVRQVAESIDASEFGAPIVARRANSMIIGGHTRWRAATEVLKLSLVPVRFLNVTQRQADVLMLADNKLGEIAEWDDDGVADLLRDMEPEERLLAGWSESEADELLKGDEPETLIEEEPPDPEPQRTRCPNCQHEW